MKNAYELPDPNPELITDPDPKLEIIPDPAGFGSTTLLHRYRHGSLNGRSKPTNLIFS
jgi:hypothetical protein